MCLRLEEEEHGEEEEATEDLAQRVVGPGVRVGLLGEKGEEDGEVVEEQCGVVDGGNGIVRIKFDGSCERNQKAHAPSTKNAYTLFPWQSTVVGLGDKGPVKSTSWKQQREAVKRCN